MRRPSNPRKFDSYDADDVDSLLYWYELRVAELETQVEKLENRVLEMNEQEEN